MIQITICKNDGFGWTVYYIYEDEEMSHYDFDTQEQAIVKAKEIINGTV